MNGENDKRLDDLFKKKLEDPGDQISYREEDWHAFEKIFEKDRKRGGIVYLLPALAAVAASLLLFLGWWAFRAENSNHAYGGSLQAVSRHGRVHRGISGKAALRANDSAANGALPDANNAATLKSGKNFNSQRVILFADSTGRTSGRGQSNAQRTDSKFANEPLLESSPMQIFSAPRFVVQEPILNPLAVAMILPTSAGPIAQLKAKKAQPAFHPQFALAILAAPDINGVGSFQQNKVGTNLGLQFSAGLSKKLTIVTGAIYSVKPYVTPFQEYHTPYQFPVNPVNVSANCRMFDIPLDIGYQVYNKKQNKISVGTGLSSYIMLHESYKFNYAGDYNTGPQSYTVPNSNKYFFGVLNLNATCEHRLNSNMGISIQPYLKLPLTNIGYSQVRLQTTGVAIGLRWNLNSSSKL